MQIRPRATLLGSLTLLALTASPAIGAKPMIRVEDVARFYRVYDPAAPAPTAEALQIGYLTPGSAGIAEFTPQRIVSAQNLAKAVAGNRPAYDRARQCEQVLPGVQRRLTTAFGKLTKVYPKASLPPVTILIGANNSGGTTGPSGVLIGLEVICSADWLETNLEDRLVHLIAHEYGHVQQHPKEGGEDAAPGDVLSQSLAEGGAEFLGEMISGEIGNPHLKRWTAGHELQIETEFLKARHDKSLGKWLYNGVGTPEKPGDLGYWVGYRISKAYYLHARNKRQAVDDILHITDPEAFLAKSGWTPGMTFPR
jgi:hypothetical protein